MIRRHPTNKRDLLKFFHEQVTIQVDVLDVFMEGRIIRNVSNKGVMTIK